MRDNTVALAAVGRGRVRDLRWEQDELSFDRHTGLYNIRPDATPPPSDNALASGLLALRSSHM